MQSRFKETTGPRSRVGVVVNPQGGRGFRRVTWELSEGFSQYSLILNTDQSRQALGIRGCRFNYTSRPV